MKITQRKITSLVSILLTAATMLCSWSAWADSWTDSSGNVWTYTGSKVTAVSFETTNLTIPDTLGGNPVTEFTADTFAGKTRAVRVTIPATVTSIPAGAFAGCSNLKAVTINGSGLKSIGATAFKNCGNLEAFVMPDSVETLDQGVFSGCTSLESVTLSDKLETLTGVTYQNNRSGCYGDSESSTTLYNEYANGLFYNCTSLKTINWGANIKTIGNIAFLNCSALEKVEIPDTVTIIGYHAFMGCSSLTDVKIGNSVTEVGRMAFRGLPNLTKVTFGSKVNKIEVQAFQDCVNLQDFTLPDTIQYLNYRAFAGCNKALTGVTIPTNKDELETILGQGVFSGCSRLEAVTFGDTLTMLTGVTYQNNRSGCYGDSESSTTLYNEYANGLFYNCTSLKTINWGANIKTIGNIAFLNCSALENVEIPDTVTTIGSHAFLGCGMLANVKIGNGVTEVGRMAFRALPNLTKVTFGSQVNKIGVQAFQDCVNLQNFTLPDTIQCINFRAFAGCNKALTSVTIPTNKDELETILGQGVFSGCSRLETVTFGDTLTMLTGVTYQNNRSDCYGDSESSTTLYNEYANGLFYNCTSLKTINWGANIKTIGNIAFLNCSALENVEIPDTVTTIGSHAFLGCGMLANVKIGNGVTEVGRMAFRALPNLTKVTFGSKVNKIEVQAFQDCVNLQNFTLPDTIQYINYRAFAGCNKALTSVTIPANKDELETELGQGVFSGCSKLATVTFGDTLMTLTGVTYQNNRSGCYGDSGSSTTLYNEYPNGLFYNCTSLKTINWGTGIKTIGDIAFLNCTSLTDVVLPENIDTIGNHAFYGCASLKTVVAEGSINSIGRRAFGNCPALHYVDFRGPVMDFEPGGEVFNFCNDRVTVYAADGSTGWKGVAEVEGLPDAGTWQGARITYAPPPDGADNPYDFYPYTLVDRVNRYDYEWPSPVLLTTNRYVRGRTIPTTCSVIREGDPVYLSYAFDEYWRGEAFTVVNRFTLSGVKSGTFEYTSTWEANATYSCGWKTNAVPELLQNLAPGNYTLTLELNAGGTLEETDYSNNEVSVDFTVVAVPKYTVSFDMNGADCPAPSSRKVYHGHAIGELPVPTAPAGWTFLGWYTAAEGGYLVTPTSVVMGAATCYARWRITHFTIGFHKNDGTGTTHDYLVKYGTPTALPGAAKDLKWAPRRGFAFMGWSTAEKSKTVWKKDQAVVSTTVNPGETIHAYAIWQLKAATSYAIQYIRNDGSGKVRTIGFNGGERTPLNSVAALGFERRGYTFGGWATSTANARARKVWKADKAYVSQATENGKLLPVYAIWTLKSGYYSIRFNKNDGTGKWRELGYEYGKNTTLPTIANGLGWVRSGYRFVGWATSAKNAAAGTVWRGDAGVTKTPVTAGKTLSLYAIWRRTGASVARSVTADDDTTGATVATVSASRTPHVSDELPPGYYSGLLADGTGTYDLLVDEGGETGYVRIVTEDGVFEAEVDVMLSDGTLSVVSDDGRLFLLSCRRDN